MKPIFLFLVFSFIGFLSEEVYIGIVNHHHQEVVAGYNKGPAAGTAPSFIQTCPNGHNFGGTSQTCVFGSNVASTSVLYAYGFTTVNTTATLAGSGAGCSGITFTTNTSTAAGGTTIEGWAIPAGTGACTITMNNGASGSQSISVAEYGPSTGGVDNMVNLALQTAITAGNNIPCPSITTAVSNERVVCGLVNSNASGGTFTAGSGFTIDGQGTSFGWAIESQAKAAAGSVTPGATHTATTSFLTGSIAIKP